MPSHGHLMPHFWPLTLPRHPVMPGYHPLIHHRRPSASPHCVLTHLRHPLVPRLPIAH